MQMPNLTELQIKEIKQSIHNMLREQKSYGVISSITTESIIDYMPKPVVQAQRSWRDFFKKPSLSSSTPFPYEEYVDHLIETEISACKEEEQSWPAVTDCDRLKGVFTSLIENNILVKENFLCCGSCASSAIRDLFEEHHVGGVFYHEQDTEFVQQEADSGKSPLYLSFGKSRKKSPYSDKEIGEKVVKSLTDAGFKVEWDGSDRTRILVWLDWKRRLNDKYL